MLGHCCITLIITKKPRLAKADGVKGLLRVRSISASVTMRHPSEPRARATGQRPRACAWGSDWRSAITNGDSALPLIDNLYDLVVVAGVEIDDLEHMLVFVDDLGDVLHGSAEDVQHRFVHLAVESEHLL